MRRNIPSFFAILLLGTLILCSACTSPGNDSATKGTGLVHVTAPVQSARISFGSAVAGLTSTVPVNDTMQVSYLSGTDVDKNGNATSWIFGIQDSSGSRLLIFDRVGRTEMPAGNGSFSGRIDLNKILPPDKLVTGKQDDIRRIYGREPARLDLELNAETYTLTLTGENPTKTIRFDATTGALIP